MADWQVGDLALCVDAGPVQFYRGFQEVKAVYVRNLRVGAVYVVTDVVVGQTGRIGIFDKRKRVGGCEDRFRKITPGHKIEGFEEPRRIPVEEKA